VSAQSWVVYTPLEFGAKNWTLILLFDESEVVGIGIRTEDSEKMKPKDAPEDRVVDEHQKTWDSLYGPTMLH
jgi:hypothetical protein